MTIEIDEDDILKEIRENHSNNIDLFFKIVDDGTNSWESFREVTLRLLKKLEQQNELKDLLEEFNK